MTKVNEIGTCTDIEKDVVFAGISRHDFLACRARGQVVSTNVPVVEPESFDIVASFKSQMSLVTRSFESIQRSL